MGITGSQKALMYNQAGTTPTAQFTPPRAGATRAGYHSPKVFLSIAGVQRYTQIRSETLTITDALDDAPNTCSFQTLVGYAPNPLEEIIITLGSRNNLERLFAGHLLSPTSFYEKSPLSTVYRANAIDYTWAFNHHLVTKRYTNQSATAILRDLVAMATGFTSNHVQADLDVIDEITFTNVPLMNAVVQVVKRIGGYAYIDYLRDLHAFTTADPRVSNPRDLTETHPSLENVQVTRDESQRRTRVTFEGGGVNALVEIAPGETVIPLEDVAWYPDGGQVVSGPQRISYSSRHLGNAGSLAGPGVSPGSPPALLYSATSGSLGTGDYKYDYTFVTAAGESTPSPLATINIHAGIANPGSALTFWNAGVGGGPLPAGTVKFGYTFVTALGESALSPLVTVTYPAPGEYAYPTVPTGPAGTTARKYYRSPSGSSTLRLVSTINDNTTTNITDTTPDSGLGSAAPTSNQTGGSAVDLSSVAIGPVGVTARKIYRSVVNGSQLKLLTTIANNSATTYTDTAADGALGANAPVSDTSGLTRADGQINPGASTLQVNGLAFADAAGGWVTDGWQLIRYAGTATLPVTLAIGITRSGSTATATAGSATGFVTGQTVTISGATQTEYNGSFVITGMPAGEGGTTFTYTVAGTPATPATGSPVVAIPGGNLLTGIPASGIGAIESPIWYGSTISAVPALAGIPSSGVGAIVETIKQGDPVNLLAQVDDLVGQAALAAVTGGDGVIEENLQDRRMSYAEALARAQAWLDLHDEPELTLAYQSRDVNTRAGRSIVVDLPAPTNVDTTLKIQEVTITNFYPKLYPTYRAVLSSIRYSFEALLRATRRKDAAEPS